MASRTSRRKLRERTRSIGTAPWSQRTPTARRDQPEVTGRRLWLAVAVVAGLFAMHGLGMHGAHASEASAAMHSEPTSSAPAIGASAMSTTIHDIGGAVPAGPVSADVSATPLASANDGPSDPSSGAGLLMLCLALLAFGMLWLRRRPNGRPAWTVPRRALKTRVAQLSVTARDLSPPLRAELSIWRC